ncbi:MAG: bifunctional DNA-formamidopyrimidine glycosylase/DNA-(apurinic or apyrimidinic site) lyase [Patescibacteria group bacterium]
MPELPEVETIKNDLDSLLVNKKIKAVKFLDDKKASKDQKLFLAQTVGVKIKAVRRRAKMIIIDLSNKDHLIVHLKMTGQLIFVTKNTIAGGGHPIKHDLTNLPNKSTRIIFDFSNGSKLFFNDTRKFGWIKLVNSEELKAIEDKYGPEPLDKNFRPHDFYKLIYQKNIPIKPLLLDQKIIAGIGNIYASEACFCAGINPLRKASDLTQAEIKKLYNCIIRILTLAIKKRGTSSETYVDAFGRQGSMNNFLKVYQRAGEKCLNCGGVIKKINQRQRSTFYCEKCQK